MRRLIVGLTVVVVLVAIQPGLAFGWGIGSGFYAGHPLLMRSGESVWIAFKVSSTSSETEDFIVRHAMWEDGEGLMTLVGPCDWPPPEVPSPGPEYVDFLMPAYGTTEQNWLYSYTYVSVPAEQPLGGYQTVHHFSSDYATGMFSVSYTMGLPIRVIPEPSTLVLLCMGAVGLLAYAWRRRRRR